MKFSYCLTIAGVTDDGITFMASSRSVASTTGSPPVSTLRLNAASLALRAMPVMSLPV